MLTPKEMSQQLDHMVEKDKVKKRKVIADIALQIAIRDGKSFTDSIIEAEDLSASYNKYVHKGKLGV